MENLFSSKHSQWHKKWYKRNPQNLSHLSLKASESLIVHVLLEDHKCAYGGASLFNNIIYPRDL